MEAHLWMQHDQNNKNLYPNIITNKGSWKYVQIKTKKQPMHCGYKTKS